MGHVPRLALENGGGGPKLGCQGLGVLEELRRGDDRRERVAELVSQRGKELVLLPVRLTQEALGSFAVGDVARDFRCADDLAIRAFDG
jgi:hypothetical protein